MTDFFKYYTEISEKVVFNNFDFSHNLSMVIILIAIVVGLKLLSKVKKENARVILKILACITVVLELSHTLWLYKCGLTDIEKLLPFHICALNIFFIPYAVFSKNKFACEYIFAFSIIGGFFGITFPSGVSGSYPIIHYQTIQTFIYHGLLIFIPIAQIVVKDFMPDIKKIYRVHILFIIIAIFVGIFDYIFDENYMFIKYPPDVYIAKWVYKNWGIGVYTFLFGVICLGGSILVYIPLEIYKKVKFKNENENKNVNEKIEDKKLEFIKEKEETIGD